MSDDLLIPPYSSEAEHSVLGGLLLDNQAYDRIADKVYEGDFYTSDNGIIFRVITGILQANKPADIVTVCEALDSLKQLEKVGGISFIAGLVQNTPTAANIERYAEIVRDRSLKRKMIQISAEISAKIYNPQGLDAKALLDFSQSRWMAVGEHLSKQIETMQHVNVVMAGVADHIDAMFSRDDKSEVTGLRTGINDLDKMTSGLQGGDLIILAGRPSMGKTAFALNILENVTLVQKKNAAFFSLEMINEQLGLRLISSVSRLPAQRVRVGRVNDDEWEQLTTAFSKMQDVGMYLDEESSLTVGDIRARARRLHRQIEGGLDLIIVDYLQLVSLEGSDTRANEMAEVSRSLKLIAKELKIPVIALSQLNRGLETRPNKRPVMSDLRDSGGIEQDADMIWFIYRDEVYNPDSMDRGIAEIIVGKQRNGPIGTVHCAFVNHLTRFENLAMGAVVPSIENFKQKSFNKQNSRGNFRDENYESVEM